MEAKQQRTPSSFKLLTTKLTRNQGKEDEGQYSEMTEVPSLDELTPTRKKSTKAQQKLSQAQELLQTKIKGLIKTCRTEIEGRWAPAEAEDIAVLNSCCENICKELNIHRQLQPALIDALAVQGLHAESASLVKLAKKVFTDQSKGNLEPRRAQYPFLADLLSAITKEPFIVVEQEEFVVEPYPDSQKPEEKTQTLQQPHSSPFPSDSPMLAIKTGKQPLLHDIPLASSDAPSTDGITDDDLDENLMAGTPHTAVKEANKPGIKKTDDEGTRCCLIL